MDALSTIGGPAMGAALTGLVWALARAIKRRGEASSALDEANAKAVVELVAQLGDLRKDLERETAARMRLEQRVENLQGQLDETESRARHYESQVAILSKQLDAKAEALAAAEKRGESLMGYLRELYSALNSGSTKLTLPPPPGGLGIEGD